MDMWSKHCRCCMSADCKVSLLDPELNLREKFLELTNIEVKEVEDLPFKLCEDCYNVMIIAYNFRKMCIKTDKELKSQIDVSFDDELQSDDKFDVSMDSNILSDTIMHNDAMKQIETTVKKNLLDSDDDNYYVLVIGNPKNKAVTKFVSKDESSVDDNFKIEVLEEYSDEEEEYLSECSYQSDDLSDYDESEIKNDKTGGHSCKLCGKYFESAEILTGHTLLHSSSGLLVDCPYCQQPIKRNALIMHIRTGHINVRPSCTVCFKTFSTSSHLKRHMAIHKDKTLKEFECDLCNKIFKKKSYMQMHRLIHTHPYYCFQCDKTFLNRTLLNEHKNEGCIKSERKLDESLSIKQPNIRGRPKKYPDAKPQKRKPRPKDNPQCYDCGEVLSNKRELQLHIQTTHVKYSGDKMKRFECSICRKRFTSGAKLTMHERVHTNERPYPCELCNNRFKTKTHLRTHQLFHSKELKYSCPLCPRKFKIKYNLHLHLRRIHASDKSDFIQTPKRKKS